MSMKIYNIMKPIRDALKHSALALAVGAGLAGFTSTAQADYESAMQALSPLGYWRLNETATSVPDYTARAGSESVATPGRI